MTNTLTDYNLWLVLVSFLVSLFGAGTGLLTSARIRGDDNRCHYGWLALSAVVLGGGAVWAMHFVGMLAFRPGIPMTYDTGTTMLSLALPVVFFAMGLWVTNRWPASVAALLGAGTVLGLGIAAMHYTGMAAVRSEAVIRHDSTLTLISIVIAVVASCAALFLLRHAQGLLRAASAPVLAVAVCGMHYTGMAAMVLRPGVTPSDYFSGAVTGPQMLMLVILVVTLIYVASLSLVWHREMRDLRQDLALKRY